MKRHLKFLPSAVLIALISAAPLAQISAAPSTLPALRGLEEVSHSQVELREGFWAPRVSASRDVTVPHALDALEADGHVSNFDRAAGNNDIPLKGHHAFDSDLYKALEGGLIALKLKDDPALRKRMDGIIARILAAQQKDGFLITYFIGQNEGKRWDDLRLEHQMYNAGHFFEMAVAHQQLTGEPTVLDAAKRFADNIGSVFGEGKRYDVDGHQEVELALVKLYRATGEKKYLDLAKFFLDERGHAHGTSRKPFDPSTVVKPVKPEGELTPEQRRAFFHATLRMRNGRMQDHKPVVDQYEAIGHAVRAGYMYSAMTDILRFGEAPGYEKALDGIWNDVVGRKAYVTGAMGTGQYGDEGFGDPYLLPNGSAYCESCAAIASVLWQHRMCLLKGDSKYADVMELSLYNGVLSGISLAGDKFCYENPLSSGGTERRSWIGLSCCPTNLARIIPQVGGLVYALGKNEVFVNLYVAGEAQLKLPDVGVVKLNQQTEYPWDGKIKITVTPTAAKEFSLALRVPGWSLGKPWPSDLYRVSNAKPTALTLTINGVATQQSAGGDGYLHIKRVWKPGDLVEMNLPMAVQRVHAHEKVEENKGKVALMRGPLVYCLEGMDQNGADVFNVGLPAKATLTADFRKELLGGVKVITTDGTGKDKLTAVPYYTWQNRGKTPMTVWITEP